MLRIVFLALLLAACAGMTPLEYLGGASAAEDLRDMKLAYTDLRQQTVAYIGLPRCVAAVSLPCSDEAIAVRLRDARAVADAALSAATRIIADTPRANPEPAIVAAKKAIGRVKDALSK